MRRITLGAVFRDLLAAGTAPEQAAFALRRLRLYRGGIEISQNDVHIDYNPKTKGFWITPAITLRGPVRLPGPGPFEVDANQAKALIQKLTKPKRKPPPGRRQHAMRADILDEYDQRLADGRPHENTDLAEWARTDLKKLKKYEKTTAPPADTIGRWLRERDQAPT